MRLTPDKRLHSREHLLADDLAGMMLEPKRFARYLGVATLYHESDLRALAKRVLAKPDLDPRNRGRYFFGALRGLPKKIIWLPRVRRQGPRAQSSKRRNAPKTNRPRTE